MAVAFLPLVLVFLPLVLRGSYLFELEAAAEVVLAMVKPQEAVAEAAWAAWAAWARVA